MPISAVLPTSRSVGALSIHAPFLSCWLSRNFTPAWIALSHCWCSGALLSMAMRRGCSCCCCGGGGGRPRGGGRRLAIPRGGGSNWPNNKGGGERFMRPPPRNPQDNRPPPPPNPPRQHKTDE